MKKVTNILSLIGAIAIGGLLMSLVSQSPKTGYVNLSKVFEEFSGKKELENKLQLEAKGNQRYLDSLSFELQNLARQVNENSKDSKLLQLMEEKQYQLNTAKARIDQYTINRHQQLTEQVWMQINQYVKDYGAEKEYEYIFGADGAGTLMYGSTNKNLTENITQYINKKYEGH